MLKKEERYKDQVQQLGEEVDTLNSRVENGEAKVHHLQGHKQDVTKKLQENHKRILQLEGHIAEVSKVTGRDVREIQQLEDRNLELTGENSELSGKTRRSDTAGHQNDGQKTRYAGST